MKNVQSNDNKGKCPVCNATHVSIFVEILNVPVHCNRLWSSREDARRAPRGDIRLGFCKDCGHIFNLAFDPLAMKYDQDYESSLHFSPTFQEYARSLAERLITHYDLRHKQVVEIGCGKGEFLHLLCELGENRGFGFDPGYVPGRVSAIKNSQITFIQDFYSDCYDCKADLICCRHVLEHLQKPGDFLADLRHAIDGSDPAIFFEVPNVLFSLKHGGIWDLIYEHCSYFSGASLKRLFSLRGFDVLKCRKAFGGQVLCIEATPGTTQTKPERALSHDVQKMAQDVVLFALRYPKQIEHWRNQLAAMESAGKRVVIWGGGSKGVTFLNVLKIQSQIAYVVDINPYKQGKYVAGSGHEIMSPEEVVEYRPDIVIVMNPIYLDEIARYVKKMNFSAELMSV